jgi:hypothetical protein
MLPSRRRHQIINGYTPYVYFPGGGSVSAWPMIADGQCTTGGGFAQVGEGEIFHAYTSSFYEVSPSCTNIPGPVEYPAGPYTSTHNYIVNHSGAPSGGYALYIDNTLVNSGTTGGWTQGDVGEYFGETHNYDDQQYGAVHTPGVFYSINFCSELSGSYTCYNPESQGVLSFLNNESYWFDTPEASSFQIGDDACSN